MFKTTFKKITEFFAKFFNKTPLPCDLSFYDQFDIDKTEDFIDMVQYIESDDNNIWESRIRDRRTGTSTAIILSALSQAIRLNKNVIIVVNTNSEINNLRKIVWRYTQTLKNIKFTVYLTSIKFESGGRITFLNISNYNLIRGFRPDLIIFDCISESNKNFEYWTQIISISFAKIRTFHENEEVKYEN